MTADNELLYYNTVMTFRPDTNYSKRQTYLVLGLILIVGALFRIYFGRGLSYADDFAYVKCAFRLNDVGIRAYLSSMSNYYDGRTAIVFPLALFIKIFGAKEIVLLRNLFILT